MKVFLRCPKVRIQHPRSAGIGATAALFLLLILLPAPGRAAVHALLVGVSTYPALGPDFTLEGPSNDIRAARDYLFSRGLDPASVTVLADDIEDADGDPTLEAIENAFEHLRQKVGPGDVVYLHFAGHGSQQLGADLVDEADDLDEVFLPMDTKPMDETLGIFPNALSDGLLRRHVTQLRNRGAFIWLVFDSCHSGGMTRGAGGGRERRVRLALDPRELRSLRHRLSSDDTVVLPPAPAVPELTREAGGFAAFFAAQDNQATLERRMLAGDDRVFGVFSFNLFSVLNRSNAISYREAANAVIATYAAQGEVSAVPKFEGTGLDQTVLGLEEQERRLSWPVVPSEAGNTDHAATYLAAGLLHGIGLGDEVAISRVDRQQTDVIGKATVVETSAFRSRLEALDDGVSQAFSSGEKGAVLWGALSRQRMPADAAIALPPPDAPVHLHAAINRIREKLRMSEGTLIRWVGSTEPAAFRILPSGGNAVLSSADAVITADGRGPSPTTIPLTGDVSQDAATIQVAVLRAVRAGRIMAIALNAAAVPFDQALTLRMQVSRVDEKSLRKVTNRAKLNCGRASHSEKEDFQNGVSVLRHCDLLSLQVSNRSRKDWDVTILFLSAENELAVLFPPVGQSNRIHEGDRLRPLQFAAFVDGTQGPRDVSERLLVIAQEAKPGFPEADFRFLAEGHDDAPSRGAGLTGYGSLLAAAGSKTSSRGLPVLPATDAGPRGTATVLRWTLSKAD